MKNYIQKFVIAIVISISITSILYGQGGTETLIAGYAGAPGYGGDGGSALTSGVAFNGITALAADSAGNVYIADNGNYRIRKVNKTTGILSTIIGNGSGSYSGDGGLGVAAGITNVNSICVNKQGDVFICDANCYRVRKLNHSTAHISTIAGNGSSTTSGDGGPATGAGISSPNGICIDNAGNIYFGDGYRVRKIAASTGYISTIAGTGTNGFSGDGSSATSANLNTVTGVVCDESGNIYFSQGASLTTDSCRIRKIDASGIITTIAGGGQKYADGCYATAAQLLPASLSIDSAGNLYCYDMMSLYSYDGDYYLDQGPYMNAFIKIINVSTGFINNFHNGGALTLLSFSIPVLPVTCIGRDNQLYYGYQVVIEVSGAASGINNLEVKDTLTSSACTLPAKYNVIVNGSINGTPGATDSATVIVNYRDGLIGADFYDSLVVAPRNTIRSFRLPYTYSGGAYHFGSTSILDSIKYTFPGTYYPQVQINTIGGYSDWYPLPVVHAGSGCSTTSLRMDMNPIFDTFLSSPCAVPRTVGFTVGGSFEVGGSFGATAPAATDSAYILFDYGDGSPLELHVVAYDTSGGTTLLFTTNHVYTATGDYYSTVWVNNSAGNAVGIAYKDIFFENGGGNPLVRIANCTSGHINTTIAESAASSGCGVPDTITYHYTGSVSDSATLDATASLNLSFGDGSSAVVTAPVVYQTSSSSYVLNGYFSHVFNIPGVYTSAHNDSIGRYNTSGFVSYEGADTFAISNSCAPLKGCFYFDANNNCVKDSGDMDLGYWPYELVNNTLHDTLYGWCNDTGGYALSVITGYSYTLFVNYFSTGATLRASCPSTGEYSFTALAGHSYPENFAFSCDTTSGVDMSVSGWGYGFIPGDTGAIAIWSSTPWGYTCDTLSSNIRLILDSRLTYRGMWDGGPTPASISGDTITWHFTTADELLDFSGFVMVTTDTSSTIGDTMTNVLYVSPTRITDPNLANNTYSFTTPVTSSFDPNEMQVSPQGYGSPGYIPNNTPLSYLVHFQNTGTASARNITISDSLSTNLDISTLQVISSSGPVLVTQFPGNVVKFRFNNINLPDSASSRSRSTGYVSFNILPRENLAPNTAIKNKAGVYFDYNAPVFTNQTINTIEDTTGISGLSSVCTSASITLTTPISAGSWLSSNANATVAAGVVSGIHPGLDTITFSAYGGAKVFTKIITINQSLSAGTITGATTICQASTSMLSTSGSGGAWSSRASSIATVNASSGLVTGITGGSANIIYVVSNICGADTATATITINPLPVSGSLSGATTVCTGTHITLTPSVSGGSWRSGSSSLATVSGGVVTGVAAGTDTVFYTVTNSCGSASATSEITINLSPVAGTISGRTSVCTGTTDTFTTTASSGTWSATNSLATVSSAGIVTCVSAGIDTIIYTVSNSCGAAVTHSAITISAMPIAGSIMGATSVCIGAHDTLTATETGGVWTSGSTLATVSGGVVTGITTGSDVIIYTVANSCGAAAAYMAVSVNPLPVAGTISGGTSVCVDDSDMLTSTISGGAWSTSSSLASVSGGVVTGVTAGMDTIIYTITNSCGSAAAHLPITINPLPVAGTLSGATSVCTGSFITLTPSVTGGLWSSSSVAIATVSSGIVSGAAIGMDTIIYTITNGCGNASVTSVITVNTLPSAGVISGLDSVCPGENITLTNSATGGTWSSANSAIATVNSAGKVTGVSAGTVIISYTETNSCGTVAATYSFAVRSLADCPTSVNEMLTATGDVSLFPNPSAGIFVISVPEHQNNVVISITDVEGRTIRQLVNDNSNNLKIPVDISNLAAGAYFVKIEVDGVIYRKKVIIW